MSLDEKIYTALKTLVDSGVVRDVRAERHEPYGEGNALPEVIVSAAVNAPEPDEHRTEIESRLRHAGFGQVVLHLHATAMRPERLSERPAGQRLGDRSVPDESAVRERANRLWEAEGRPAGRGEEYWFRAQELIDDESQASYPPSQSRGNRT